MRKWAIFLLVVCASVLCKDRIVEGGIFLVLRAFLDPTLFAALRYEKAYLERGAIVLENVAIEREAGACAIEKVYYHVKEGLVLVRPDIVFFETLEGYDVLFAGPLCVKEGRLHAGDRVWLFDVADGVVDVHFAKIAFAWDQEEACLVWETRDMDLSGIFPGVASPFVSAQGRLWETGALSCDLMCEGGGMQGDTFELMAKRAAVHVIYSPTQAGLLVRGELEGGSLSCTEGRVENLVASYSVDGVSDPRIILSGEIRNVPFSLECRAQVDVNRLDLYDLHLDTTEGSLSAPAISMLYDDKGGPIDIYAPSLQCTHVSLLSPLVIEALEVKDFSGRWGDMFSYRGQGALAFTHTLEGVIVEPLANMGVEPKTLVPSFGQLGFELRDGKCFFIECFQLSSAEREFVFEGDPFIDVLGRLHIDVRVLEDPAKELLEPVTLSFRGTLGALLCAFSSNE